MNVNVVVTIKRFYSKLNQFFSHHEDPFKGVEHLISLEETGKRWLISPNGYPEAGQSKKDKKSDQQSADYSPLSLIIEIGNYISMVRLTLLCFTNNHILNIICGDFFIGTSSRFYMNCTLAICGWLVVIFRSMLYWSDRLDKLSWLTVFTTIKHHGFNSSLLGITPSGANQLRNKVYLVQKLMTLACPVTTSFVFGIMFYSFLSNPVSYQSRKLLFFQFFWSTLITVQAFVDIIASFWLVAHIYLLICYCSLQLDAIDLTIDRLLSQQILKQTNEIMFTNDRNSELVKVNYLNQTVRTIVGTQNYTSGYIFKLSDQIKQYVSIGYFYASFAADFLIYSACVMPTDHLFNNIVVTSLGIEILIIAMSIILFLSQVSAQASSSYGKYHQLIQKVQLEVMTKQKISSVMCTIGDSFIGFYIGDVFQATMNQYVEFILGNCSMMLMLIGIMQKIT